MFNRAQIKRHTKITLPLDDTDPVLLTKNVQLKENRDIEKEYVIGAYLGSGKFGEVRHCSEKSTGKEFAAKHVPIASKEDKENVLNEIAIMNRLRHPRLIQLYDAYCKKEEMTLVIELITGGELFERIIDESFDLNEANCVMFMQEIMQGVEYIHSQNVMHLDLKPENILCLSQYGFKIKIIDFGLARFYGKSDVCVFFGTPEFTSPEVLSYDPVSPAADMWSVGVICFVLLSGLSPFMGDNDGETFSNILRAMYTFDYPEFDEISADAKDFIKRLLLKDPKSRMTAGECLEHRWLKPSKKLKRVGTVSKKRLRRFVFRRKWQKAVNAIIALQRMGVVLVHSPLPSDLSDDDSTTVHRRINKFSNRNTSSTGDAKDSEKKTDNFLKVQPTSTKASLKDNQKDPQRPTSNAASTKSSKPTDGSNGSSMLTPTVSLVTIKTTVAESPSKTKYFLNSSTSSNLDTPSIQKRTSEVQPSLSRKSKHSHSKTEDHTPSALQLKKSTQASDVNVSLPSNPSTFAMNATAQNSRTMYNDNSTTNKAGNLTSPTSLAQKDKNKWNTRSSSSDKKSANHVPKEPKIQSTSQSSSVNYTINNSGNSSDSSKTSSLGTFLGTEKRRATPKSPVSIRSSGGLASRINFFSQLGHNASPKR